MSEGRNAKPPPPPGGQFLVYQTEDGTLKIDVRFEGETVWLAQAQMADLFQTTKQNVSLHIQNVFSEGELPEGSVVKESLTTAADGNSQGILVGSSGVCASIKPRSGSIRSPDRRNSNGGAIDNGQRIVGNGKCRRREVSCV
jgi:hypothetical protein